MAVYLTGSGISCGIVGMTGLTNCTIEDVKKSYKTQVMAASDQRVVIFSDAVRHGNGRKIAAEIAKADPEGQITKLGPFPNPVHENQEIEFWLWHVSNKFRRDINKNEVTKSRELAAELRKRDLNKFAPVLHKTIGEYLRGDDAKGLPEKLYGLDTIEYGGPFKGNSVGRSINGILYLYCPAGSCKEDPEPHWVRGGRWSAPTMNGITVSEYDFAWAQINPKYLQEPNRDENGRFAPKQAKAA